MVRSLRLGLFVIAALLAAAMVAVPRSGLAQIDRDIRDRVVPAAVAIAVNVLWKENDFEWLVPLPLGSGTIVSADGLILTNYHVVDPVELETQMANWSQEIADDMPGVELSLSEDEFLILVSDGINPPAEQYTAQVIQSDSRLDLAVLRISGDAAGSAAAVAETVFPFVPLGDSNAVGLGDRVHVFSYPAIGGDALTYTDGVVSGFLRDEGIDGVAWITTDAVISGGSSGGTAINDQGQLIGVPTQGSELDCRPGDTNRDGTIDVDDIGCIPIGGSLGQLRPINLALSLLGADDLEIRRGSDDPTVLEKSQTKDLDLPRLALNPLDLQESGFDDYAVEYGQLTDANGAPALLGAASTWAGYFEQAGLQEVYLLSNVWMSPNATASRYLDTLIWRYADAVGAKEGFDLVERQIEGFLLVTDDPSPPNLGNESELSQWEYVDQSTQTEMVAVELTFTLSNLVGSVRKSGPIGSESSLKHDIESLAVKLHDRLAVALSTEEEPGFPLSDQTIRLVDGGLGGVDFYLATLNRAAIPMWWHVDRAVTTEWEAYWHAIGVEDAYQHEIRLPANSVEADSRIEVKLYRFSEENAARDFVNLYDEDLRSLGATMLQELLDAPMFGDESRTLTFQTDLWADVDPEYRIATVIRVGGATALIEALSEEALPVAGFLEIARAQEACLQHKCVAMTMEVPAALRVAETTPEPTVKPMPTATPSPTHTPAPTATPRPTPTPMPVAWGFIESFDENSGIVPQNTDISSASLAEGYLSLTIKSAGGIDGFFYDSLPTDGRDFEFSADVASTSGWGETHLTLSLVAGDADWYFAVDAVTQEWYLHRASTYTQELFYWVEPRNYAGIAPGPLRSLEVRVINGTPTFLINGVDVVSPTGISMPTMGGSIIVGFGAGINPFSLSGHGDTFTVVFDQVRLAELP